MPSLMRLPVGLLSLAIVLLAPQVGYAQTQQQAVRKLAKQIVDQGKTEPLDKSQQEGEPYLGGMVDWRIYFGPAASFRPPQTITQKGKLWYDLGFVDLEGVIFDFSLPLEQPLGYASEDEVEPDVYDYPLKGQLFVELIRKFRNTPQQRAGWDPKLAQIERIVGDEIKAIEASLARPADEQGAYDPNTLAGNEPLDTLKDYDARIVRIVLGHLDDAAARGGLVLRKNRMAGQAGGPPAYEVSFKFRDGDSPPNTIYSLCEAHYQYLKSWKRDPEQNLDNGKWEHARWKRVSSGQGATGFIPPGPSYVIAVWEESDGNKQWAKSLQYPFICQKNGDVVEFGDRQK